MALEVSEQHAHDNTLQSLIDESFAFLLFEITPWRMRRKFASIGACSLAFLTSIDLSLDAKMQH